MINPVCPYCNKESKWVSGRVIYPDKKDLHARTYFSCIACSAHVGAHKKTGKPMGTLACKKLRRLRGIVHNEFDKLWENKPNNARTRAYRWLAEKLEIDEKDCHIAMFDMETCEKAIEICNHET